VPRNRERRIRGTRVLTFIGVGALIAAAAATAAFALTKNNASNAAAVATPYTPPALPYSSSTVPPTAASTSSAVPTPAPTPSTDATAAGPTAQRRVVFIGDGYTASDGATDAAHGFPALVGQAENWNVTVVACAQAGYVVQGTCGTDYAGLIPQVVADKPDLVIVTGGRNDTPQASASAAAARAFFAQLAAAAPGVPVYAVSPVWDDDPGQAPLGVVQQSVRTGATASGAQYVDIGEPLRDQPSLIGPGGVMPNDAGYAALAAAIEKALPAPSAG